MSDPTFAAWVADWHEKAKANRAKIEWAQTRLAALSPDAYDIVRELEDAYSEEMGQHETMLWRMVRRHFPPEFAGLIEALDDHISDAWKDEAACCQGAEFVQAVPGVRPRFLFCVRSDGAPVTVNLSLVRWMEQHPAKPGHARVWFGPADGEDYLDLNETVSDMHDAAVGWTATSKPAAAAR